MKEQEASLSDQREMDDRRLFVSKYEPRARARARFDVYTHSSVAEAPLDRGGDVVDLASSEKPAAETWVRVFDKPARVIAFALLLRSGRDDPPDFGSQTLLLPDGTAQEQEGEEGKQRRLHTLTELLLASARQPPNSASS